jgi:hypothetical protein
MRTYWTRHPWQTILSGLACAGMVAIVVEGIILGSPAVLAIGGLGLLMTSTLAVLAILIEQR